MMRSLVAMSTTVGPMATPAHTFERLFHAEQNRSLREEYMYVKN